MRSLKSSSRTTLVLLLLSAAGFIAGLLPRPGWMSAGGIATSHAQQIPPDYYLTLEEFWDPADGNNYNQAFTRLMASPRCSGSCQISAIQDRVGFDLRGRAIIGPNVYVRGYRHGVRANADAHRTGEARSNANMTRVRDTLIAETDHAAIYLDGGDSNAGLV